MDNKTVFLFVLVTFSVGVASARGQSMVPQDGQRATLEIALGAISYDGPADLLRANSDAVDVHMTTPSFSVAGSFPLVANRIYFRLLAGISGFNAQQGETLVGSSDGLNPFLTEEVVWFEPGVLVRLRPAAERGVRPYVFAGFGSVIADPFGGRNQTDRPGSGIPGPERSSFTVPMGVGLDIGLTPSVSIFAEAASIPHFNYVLQRETRFPKIRRNRVGFGLRVDILKFRARRFLKRNFQVSPLSINVDDAGAAESILIDADGIRWLATNDAEWVVLDSHMGTGTARIRARISENTSTLHRTGTIRVLAGGAVEKVTINQAGAPLTQLEVSPTNLRLPFHEGSEFVRVDSNRPWVAEESIPWLTIERDATGIRMQYSENESLSARSGTVTVSAADSVRSIEIVQGGTLPPVVLEVEPDSLLRSNSAGSATLRITSSEPGFTAGSDAEWLDINRTDHTVEVQFRENPSFDTRSTEITISLRGVNRKIYVEQSGKSPLPVELEVEPDSLLRSNSAGSATLRITSSEPGFTAGSDAEWLDINRTDSTVAVQFEENQSDIRSTEINISLRGVSRTVYVEQSGKSPPEPQPEPPNLKIDLALGRKCLDLRLKPVVFNKDSVDLTPSARDSLSWNATLLKDCPSRTVEISVDRVPSERDAERKRRDRIQIIRQYYINNGIAESRLINDPSENDRP